MASSKTPVDYVRSAIRAWASGPSGDIASLEEAWCTAGMSAPLYSTACAAIFPTLEALVDYFSCARHKADRFPRSLASSSSSAIGPKRTFEPVQVFASVGSTQSEGQAATPVSNDDHSSHVSTHIDVEGSVPSKVSSARSRSTSSAGRSARQPGHRRRKSSNAAKGIKKDYAGGAPCSAASASVSSSSGRAFEAAPSGRNQSRRVPPVHTRSQSIQTNPSTLRPVQNIPANASDVASQLAKVKEICCYNLRCPRGETPRRAHSRGCIHGRHSYQLCPGTYPSSFSL